MKIAASDASGYYRGHIVRRSPMSELSREDALEKIKRIQENIAVVIGTTFTITLCVYFFTYAMLVDKGLSGGLWAMGISSLIMLLMLIKLKHVYFFLTRLLYARNQSLHGVLTSISVSDL